MGPPLQVTRSEPWKPDCEHGNQSVNMETRLWTWKPDSEHGNQSVNMETRQWTWKPEHSKLSLGVEHHLNIFVLLCHHPHVGRQPETIYSYSFCHFLWEFFSVKTLVAKELVDLKYISIKLTLTSPQEFHWWQRDLLKGKGELAQVFGRAAVIPAPQH